jgi:hypothetical protein
MNGAMRLIALLSCLAALLIGATAAAGAAPSGVLTAAEYTQLASAQKALNAASSPNAAAAVCTRTQAVSPLLAAWKTGCTQIVGDAIDGIKAQSAAKSCTKHPTVASRMTCMLPSYQAYYLVAAAYYRADKNIDRVATARGFSSSCVAVLGDPPKVVAAEGRVASDLKQLVNALRTKNVAALQTTATLADKDQRQAQASRPTSLSLCQHE